jgi:hypothetical protein
MPTVTLDTLVAEYPDVTALIDAARRDGYDIALVDVSQVLHDPQRSSDRSGSLREPPSAETALVLRAGLVHITGTQDGALMTETSGALVLTFAPEMLADPTCVPLPPIRISPSATPAEQRQWRVIRRPIVCFLRTLQIIRYGAAGPFGVSASCPADPARQFQAAASPDACPQHAFDDGQCGLVGKTPDGRYLIGEIIQ